VSLKTVVTVALVAVGTWAAVEFVERTIVALAWTVTALMIAVALNHGVALLTGRGMRRSLALVIVALGALAVLVGLAFTVIPPAVGQGKALVVKLPDILRSARDTRVFHFLDDRLHVADRLLSLEKAVPQMLEETAAPILTVVGGLLSGVAAVVSVAVLAVFMLIFGGGLVRELLRETLPERRPRYQKLLDKTYASIGGYLLGVGLICFANATFTTLFLAIVRIPFFLPLGIVSGMSSMIPYAGPAVVGTTVTLIALATGGTGIGIACAIFFVSYGQLEGQVLSPLIFKRTVHVNPLVVVLSILFFGELAGIIGAVLAVPAAAALQIVARELLRMRREKLHLAATPLNSPDRPPLAEKAHETSHAKSAD
jgi:predicted PurR-regulated permease PerM